MKEIKLKSKITDNSFIKYYVMNNLESRSMKKNEERELLIRNGIVLKI